MYSLVVLPSFYYILVFASVLGMQKRQIVQVRDELTFSVPVTISPPHIDKQGTFFHQLVYRIPTGSSSVVL